MRRLALIMVLFLLACTQANVRELPPLPTPQEQLIVNDKPIQQLEPQPELPKEKQLTKWQQMVVQAHNTTNYEFKISHGITGGATFKVRDHKIKLSYGKAQNIVRGKIIDTIYFDTAKREAIALCKRIEKICDFYANEKHTLVYDTAYIKTPRDWMLQFQKIKPKSITPEAQIIDQRFTTEVIFETARALTKIYVDEFTGLPVRVIEQTDGTQTIEYEEPLVGTVQLSEVVL